MLNSPEFIEQMSTMLADPRVLEQIAAIDPRIRGLSPQMLQAFRQMVYVGLHSASGLLSPTLLGRTREIFERCCKCPVK